LTITSKLTNNKITDNINTKKGKGKVRPKKGRNGRDGE
jgi:hypothetical protein